MSGRSIERHHVVRLVAVATSIVTARHLFANTFHYPLLMLIAHVTLALLVEGLLGAGLIPADTISTTTSQRQPHNWTPRIWQALYAAATAVGLVFMYHSFLHNRNTTLAVLILSLDWAAMLNRTGKWLDRDRQLSMNVILSISTFVICIALLITRETLLVAKGIEWLLFASICMAVAKCLRSSGRVGSTIKVRSNEVDIHVAGLVVCLPLAILLLIITSWYNRRDFDVSGRIIGILISMVSGTVSILSDTSLKRLSCSIQENLIPATSFNLKFGGPVFFVLVLSIVEIDNCLVQHRPSTTTVVQWLAFTIAYLATTDIGPGNSSISFEEPGYISIPTLDSQNTTTDGAKTPTGEDSEASFPPNHTNTSRQPWYRYISLAWQAVLAMLALTLLFSCAVSRSAEEPNERYWDLDVVIARYEEPIDQVIKTTRLALDLSNFAGRKVRTIVYNKGVLNETELQMKFPEESHLVVRQLENVGREADTYLAHALDPEQDWASHTLFLQAEPHTPGYLQARLRDYLVEETGFLTLSHVRNFCPSCDTCNDHSGWAPEPAVMKEIYERANGNQTCHDISLNYRGQFVVSARRMKQADPDFLRDLKNRVGEDVAFGYTLERAWGTIFQCPTISERCPTLLSGWLGNRVSVEDCQCVDDIEL
ncbi:hypothetical protein GGS20DRAFT_574920 [Poronia punctata]|nr:hypothetical protein GGS20DRAFT_574920 [Poronia punctata]